MDLLPTPSDDIRPAFAFWTPSSNFLVELAEWIGDRTVLEIFAGNGLLAAQLSKHGVNITATSMFRGYDGHRTGMYFDVVEMSAFDAVLEYPDADLLLVSWPEANDDMLRLLRFWDKPIIFIGEVTDYEAGFLGGCASDAFFDAVEQVHQFTQYNAPNPHHRAVVFVKKAKHEPTTPDIRTD